MIRDTDPGALPDSYCVLDRWNIIGKGNFFCGVKLRKSDQIMNKMLDLEIEGANGQRIKAPHEWYQSLKCDNFADVLDVGSFGLQ